MCVSLSLCCVKTSVLCVSFPPTHATVSGRICEYLVMFWLMLSCIFYASLNFFWNIFFFIILCTDILDIVVFKLDRFFYGIATSFQLHIIFSWVSFRLFCVNSLTGAVNKPVDIEVTIEGGKTLRGAFVSMQFFKTTPTHNSNNTFVTAEFPITHFVCPSLCLYVFVLSVRLSGINPTWGACITRRSSTTSLWRSHPRPSLSCWTCPDPPGTAWEMRTVSFMEPKKELHKIRISEDLVI